MTRAYIRLDPGFYERKLAQGYPLPAIAALAGCFCMGEYQAERGHFRDQGVLRALLGPGGRWIPFLVEHEDLALLADRRVYVVGWKEWQEGDITVGERVQRVRAKRAARNAERNGASNGVGNGPHRDAPSDGGRPLGKTPTNRSAGGGADIDGAPLRAPRSDRPTRDEARGALTRIGQLLGQERPA